MDTPYCRYFAAGYCKIGDKCPYPHVKGTDKGNGTDNNCRYLKQGRGLKGVSSEFSHGKPAAATRRIIKPISLVTEKMAMKDFEKNSKSSDYRERWLDAAEFVPKQSATPTYADITKSSVEYVDDIDDETAALLLCPFTQVGVCTIEDCPYQHGLECDLCGRQCLLPDMPEQWKEHREECMRTIEKNMEYSFAVQRSEGVSCSICMEDVTKKSSRSERRFGLLVNCNHPFCINCIRQWRSSTGYDNTIIRACPMCRVPSPFVIPSEIWIEDSNEKNQLIQDYKAGTSQKPCRFFNEGNGTCRFGSNCFYRHAYRDGTLAEIKLRVLENSEGEIKVARDSTLWDFIDARENYIAENEDLYSGDA